MIQPDSATAALPCVGIHLDDLILAGALPARGARVLPVRRAGADPADPRARAGRRCPTKRTTMDRTTPPTMTKKKRKKTRTKTDEDSEGEEEDEEEDEDEDEDDDDDEEDDEERRRRRRRRRDE